MRKSKNPQRNTAAAPDRRCSALDHARPQHRRYEHDKQAERRAEAEIYVVVPAVHSLLYRRDQEKNEGERSDPAQNQAEAAGCLLTFFCYQVTYVLLKDFMVS